MAMQLVGAMAPFPSLPAPDSAAPAFTTADLLDATAEKFAFIFRAPRTGTLNRVGFRLGAVTQAPTNGLRVSFQNLDVNGEADGTADQYRVVTAGLTANTWVTTGLMTSDGTDGGAKRSVTAEDWIACVIEFASFNASDSLVIAAIDGGQATPSLLSYITHLTSSWSRRAEIAVIALEYVTDGYVYISESVTPAVLLDTTSYASNSTPDERGMLFQLTVPARMAGFWVRMASANAARDFDVVLYDAAGSVLRTATIDANNPRAITGQTATGLWSSAYDLAANTDYRLVIKPTTTGAISLYEYTIDSSAIAASLPGGSTWKSTTRTDAGSWTDEVLRRAYMGLLLSGFDDGTGGGGGGGRSTGLVIGRPEVQTF